MIPIERALLVGTAVLLTACDWGGGGNMANPPVESNGTINEGQSSQATASAKPRAQPSAMPARCQRPKEVLEAKDIMVNGQPACELMIRFGRSLEQPQPWSGESCAKLCMRLSSIDDLKRIGQDDKLDEDMLDDLAKMPGQRALYIEGEHSSALFLENVMRQIYEVPLAD